MLNFKTRNVIDVGDWDNLVVETYGRPYNFQQQNGCQERQQVYINIPEDAYDYENDTIPEVINGAEMGVSFVAWLSRDPKEWNGKPEDSRFLDLFWYRNFYPDIQMVANALHSKGLIPAGEYYINIDW